MSKSFALFLATVLVCIPVGCESADYEGSMEESEEVMPHEEEVMPPAAPGGVLDDTGATGAGSPLDRVLRDTASSDSVPE